MIRRTLVSSMMATLALGGIVPSGAKADALDSIKARKVLRVAVPQDSPPFGTVGSDMSLAGYDIDVANLVAAGLGAKAELVPVTSGNRVPYLQTNKVDLVISTLGKTEEREKVIDFSIAYAPFFNGVFAPPALKIASPADLSKKTVAVSRGSVEDLELTRVAPADAIIKRYEDTNGTISSFLSGQAEAIATGNVVAAAILGRNPPRKPELKFLMKNSPCFIGLGKNEPALKAAVDAILMKAKADGTLDRISQKWLHADLPKDLI